MKLLSGVLWTSVQTCSDEMKLVTIVGARPQFIKAAPVSAAIALHNHSTRSSEVKIDEILVHTGQHYDSGMSAVFFESLSLTTPKYNLGVGSGSHGQQISRILERIEPVLQAEQPDWVMVYGDTNSTFGGALVASRLHVPVAHVEAGLRSFNRAMPEESNRILTDHLSSLLFAPTSTAIRNLKREGITNGVFLVGDVMQEAALQYGEVAENESTILGRLRLYNKAFSLVTLHRAENTDNPDRMEAIVDALATIAASQPLVWPMHPRTRQRLATSHFHRLQDSQIRLIDPVPYFDMLLLEKRANVVLTDSGGVQKEAMWLGVPCVTMRDESEWLETVESGWNQVVGADTALIISAFEKAISRVGQRRAVSRPTRPASELIVEQIWATHSAGAKQCTAS
jgi:UDP-GlcNAc3NAcA epimerase